MALAGSACCSSSTATPRIGLTRRDAVPKHTPLSARACARACMHSARRALESQARALDCLWGCDAGARVPAHQQRLLPDLPVSRLDLGAGQRRGRQRLLQPRWLRAVRVTVQQPQPSPVCAALSQCVVRLRAAPAACMRTGDRAGRHLVAFGFLSNLTISHTFNAVSTCHISDNARDPQRGLSRATYLLKVSPQSTEPNEES